MKLAWIFVALAAVAASVGACANALNNDPGGFGGDGGSSGEAASGHDGGAASPDEPGDSPSHAQGVITLGETHVAGENTSSPVVAASFAARAPDGVAAKCSEDVDGCKVTVLPDCSDGSDAGTSTCTSTQVCVLDDDCKAYCEDVPSCDPICDPVDEECKLVGLGSKCVPHQDFNAGILTISGEGVTKSITMRPPYGKYIPQQGDSAISATGGPFKIAATGASDYGFDAFTDTDFAATTLIQTSPGLESLTLSDIFESSALTVGWKPARDTSKGDKIRVTVTAEKGSAVCEVDDAAGTFDVTHTVIKKLHSPSATNAGASVSVARVRTEVRKDKKLVIKNPRSVQSDDDTPPPTRGDLTVITTSTETFSIQPCAAGYQRCPSTTGTGATCIDVQNDSLNCGQCGKVCDTNNYYECYDGVCTEY